MAKRIVITYQQYDGRQQVIEASPGTSVMQAAIVNGVTGILGDCGGACQCATCHVYIDQPWQALLPLVGDMEDAMLDSASAPRLPHSRLACEITITAQMEGMLVSLPASQF